jgi:hypothetical protein
LRSTLKLCNAFFCFRSVSLIFIKINSKTINHTQLRNRNKLQTKLDIIFKNDYYNEFNQSQ